MEINTASAAIRFAVKLEEDSASLYEDFSRRYAEDGVLFLSFVKENRKNAMQVERAYREVISDAIEGCFAFDISPDVYSFQSDLRESASYTDALGTAVKIEKKIMRFYSDAAEQSKSLMADIPRAFKIIARKRGSRISKLESLAGESSPDA